tara:strand:+ start:104 stop:1093 length:990 start_codon:yes stop_codon:yes gene_type:complete
MIIKAHEINKFKINQNKMILIYGNNNGLKKEIIYEIVKSNKKRSLSNYEEKEILDNQEIFFSNILTKSLFEEDKIIIIKRATEKIFKLIEEVNKRKIVDLLIIIETENLEKKSKLRLFFEKDKINICVPCYPDNEQTLTKLAFYFFKEKKINISMENINIIINKCKNDRENLFNELKKIELYCKNKNQISEETILKLVNRSENHQITELVDNCLAKNQKKTANILNENNFSNEDCILITRVFLNKSKKILNLTNDFEKNNDLDLTISMAKPPIFWKDKEITKRQIFKWKSKKIKDLIYKINQLEINVKKNQNNQINFVRDFILEQSAEI